MTSSLPSSPAQRRIVWGVRIVLALAFGAAGAAKLAGLPQMVQVFDAIGAGQWFRHVTGLVEVGGAVLLLVPATGFLGGLLLAVTMACAVATHLVLIGGNPAPAVVLALLSAFVAWRLWPVPRAAGTTA
ncbi:MULTISPECIES: DoxX family protein [unclassified Variovorax]|uniref:DoxX family protein n=1 Tax=unclassified Variovorax TaxID=663243 RepID=UPI0008C38599|nr:MULTISPECIES: DoxX family protein [unclassified Variovorax]SEJ95940.1 DoxX-like family protein [Variovorax sp. OK202]SFD20028.1 DoxX-like family protein [Variovorax sp. OK212]